MGRKTNHKKRYEHSGRPTVMTPDVLGKLEDAFMNAFTDEMACLYAGIHRDTLYAYCQENPAFSDRKETLKMTPDLRAQQTIIKDIDNVGGARYWAEHRMAQFMPTTKVIVGGTLKTEDVTTSEILREVTKKYEDEIKQSIIKNIKTKK